MKHIYKLKDGRIRFFAALLEHSNTAKELGFSITMDDWNMDFAFGYLLGKIYISFDHKLLYRIFPKFFSYGREISLFISRERFRYNLAWHTDPDYQDSWRRGYMRFK